MRVPLSWLGNHVDVDVSPEALADKLTFAGVEIETVERVGEDLAGIVTARVLEVTGHPNADRLVLVRIDAGGDDRSVVCGARNFAPGDVVPWAAPGAKLPGGIEVGRRQVRGEWSDGMLASARELGVFDDHSGILVLPPDTTVGVDLVEAVGLRDAVLEVKSAPNRGDTLSMRGIAREVAVLLGTELKPLDLTVPEAGPAADGLAEIEVEDAEGCPLYVARVVQGLDATRPAPLWMAKRLYLYGMRPLGAVVDVTNYLLLDQGQPLHAFDLDRVPGQRIVVRRAGEGETLRTLDGRDRRLTAADTLITSGEQALALAGIMGGEDSEVRPDTTRVLIESAHFPPAVVRRTMRRLGMSTEGGQRWARGVDPAGAEPVCDQAARLMAQLAGGTVAAGRLRAGPGVGERPAIRLDWARSAARLGAPTDPRFAAGQLRSVGCRTEVPDDRTVVAVPPSWRFDIELWADLEEEVARRWGYDQVPATLPKATGGRLTDEQRLRRQARGLLAGMGLTEAQTYPFLSQAALDQLGSTPTTRAAGPCAWPTPSPRRRRSCAPLCSPGSRRWPGATWRGASPGSPSTSWARCSCRRRGGRRGPAATGGCPTSRSPSGCCWPASASAAASTTPPRRSTSPTSRAWSRGWSPASASTGSATGPRARRRTIPGAAPGCSSTSAPSGCSASSTRGWRPTWSCRWPPSPPSWSWRRCWPPCPACGPPRPPRPTRSCPSTSPSWSRPGSPPATWRRRCARPAGSC